MTLRRSRIGSVADVARISAAVQRPGIDTRIWCSLAYAVDESVLDETHGHLVDVVLLPSNLALTVRVAQALAGANFGTHEGLIHKNDEIVVVFPDGDPGHGGFALARVWSASDTPPDLAVSNPSDKVTVLENGASLRTKLSGDGEVQLEGEAEVRLKTSAKAFLEANTAVLKSGNVRLGDESASQSVLLGDTYRSAEGAYNALSAAHFTAAAAAWAALALIPAIVAVPATAALCVTAGTTATAAAAGESTFEGGAAGYLSAVSKTQ